jgi:hypothetical protein
VREQSPERGDLPCVSPCMGRVASLRPTPEIPPIGRGAGRDGVSALLRQAGGFEAWNRVKRMPRHRKRIAPPPASCIR